MKSAMPYHGVPAPLLRKLTREIFRPIVFKDESHWQALVLELWRNAQFREERYAALHLLYACIESSMASKEFFLQKAIGWALRQYAWIDAAEIRRHVADNAERLSALSKREALKNVS
jgi:3-methyladenine DNA glycosylase AlkD